MALSIGIVGLPNVGKSTLFNALTNKAVAAENFPFCTIDPSVGVVAVPDDRLEQLAQFSGSIKKIPAAVEFVDIAGLVKGASEGEGLGNQFLANIRETDAILQVVRLFEDSDIIHVSGRVEPLDDIEVINLELVMADLDTVNKRLGNLDREVKRNDKVAIKEHEVCTKLRLALETGKLARTVVLTEDEQKIAKQLSLLSLKPILYVLNRKSVGQNVDDRATDERYDRLMHFFETTGAKWVQVDAGIESELKDLAHEDKITFRREFGVLDDGINALIRAGYELLDLMTYFTTGPEETRAWTIKKNSTAPIAGTAIHTDFKDKFIRAEVVPWDKLIEAGSFAVAREKGWVRTEGKEYIVKDGDVIEFKI